MSDTALHPIKPRPDQLEGFNYKQGLWAGWQGDTLVFGDSRAAEYDRGLVADAVHEGGGQIANWGVNGAEIPELWWMAKHMTTDLSHVDKIIIASLGGNDLDRTDESGRDMAKAEVKLIKVLLAHAAPGAKVLVTEEVGIGQAAIDARDNTHWTDARLHDFNRAMDHLEETTGLYDWRTTPHPGAPPTNGDYWKPDQIHWHDLFYADFINPVVEDAFGLSTHAASALDPDLWA